MQMMTSDNFSATHANRLFAIIQALVVVSRKANTSGICTTVKEVSERTAGCVHTSVLTFLFSTSIKASCIVYVSTYICTYTQRLSATCMDHLAVCS